MRSESADAQCGEKCHTSTGEQPVLVISALHAGLTSECGAIHSCDSAGSVLAFDPSSRLCTAALSDELLDAPQLSYSTLGRELAP